jgi:hypothetical protein
MRVLGAVLVVLAIIAWGPGALGADMMNAAKRELQTATTHARNAAAASTTANIELHLHHVINCLEGKSGKNFFAASGDVCEGMGNGLFKDLKDSGMAGAHALPYAEVANQIALWGLAQGMAKNVAAAKAAAEMTALALEKTQANFK